jgi:hypothetical protein
MRDPDSPGETFASGSIPPAAPLSGRLERVRRLLAGVVAVDDLDLLAAGYLQMAATELLDTIVPPTPLEPEPPKSTSARADLGLVLGLLDEEVAHAVTAAQSIHLAVIIRHVQDALTHLPVTSFEQQADAGTPTTAVARPPDLPEDW